MAGNALLKEFDLSVDIKRSAPIQPFEVVEGDTGSVIRVSVTDDGSPVELEDKYVTAVFQSARGTRILDSGEGGITLDGSTAEIALLPTAVAPGPVVCELQIRSSTADEPESFTDYDVLVTTARFTFTCRAAMLNEDALEALPETPLLNAFLLSAEEAEQARAAAEAEREAAENARALAESERAAEEAMRVYEFESLLAAATGISKTGYGAPSGSTVGSSGQLYFDLTNERVYVCCAESPSYVWKEVLLSDGCADAVTVKRVSTYAFGELPYNTEMTLRELTARLAGWHAEISSKQGALTFDQAPSAQSTAPVTSAGIYAAVHDEDWQDVFRGSLSDDVSEIVLDSYSSGLGSGGFSFDELRLVLIGGMTDGSAARLYINENTSSYMRFSSFALDDEDCAMVLYLREPRSGFATAERISGGSINGLSYTASSTVHAAMLKITGLTAYTKLRLLAESGAAFASGSTLILQGRNVH